MNHHALAPGFLRFPHFHTCELEAARTGLAASYGDCVMDVDGAAADFEWHVAMVPIGPITVLPCYARGDIRLRGEPKGYLIGLGAQVAAQARSGRKEVSIAAGRAAGVYSPGTQVAWRGAGERHITSLRIDSSFLQGELEALTGAPVRRPLQFDIAMPLTTGYGETVERISRFIVGEIERGAELHPLVAASLSEALVRALLLGQPHDHAHLLDKRAQPAGRAAARLVEEYVEADPFAPMHMRDLAALTQASGRAVHAAFRAHRGSALQVYIRQARIRALRRLLARARSTPMAGGLGAAGPIDRRNPRDATSPVDAAPRETASVAARMATLSAREREVCELLVQGQLNKQVAADLGISESTVKVHRAKLMKKLGVGSLVELVWMMARLRGGER